MNNPSLVFCDMPVRWWQISVIGIIIFISGIDAFFWTPMFIGLLIPIFGLLALSVGAIMIAFSLSMKEELVHQFPVFFAGALSLIIAVVALLLPGFIEPSFIIIMAFLAIINSVLLIIVGCSLSEEWKTRLVIVLFGMLTLFLSILMALFPESLKCRSCKNLGSLCVGDRCSLRYCWCFHETCRTGKSTGPQ